MRHLLTSMIQRIADIAYSCPRWFLSGSLLRCEASRRYSSTASGVVAQFRPTFLALRRPLRARRFSCDMLKPLMAAASASEMSSSLSNWLAHDSAHPPKIVCGDRPGSRSARSIHEGWICALPMRRDYPHEC